MNESIVREIAEQIVREQIVGNWKLYAVLGALWLVASAAGGWLSTYIKKRAETYATKADLKEVLAQLKATTEATEQVKVAISHSDWSSKEWKTLRRVKLEELLETAYSLEHWMDEQRNAWMFDAKKSEQRNPIDKLNLLGTLYFPELKDEVLAVVRTHRAAYLELIEASKKALAAGKDLAAREAVFVDFLERWQQLFAATHKSLVDLTEKAPSLLKQITGA
ncbi:MAG: hypothetical protein KF892_24155 [Rhizobacter sp.]|nr:hypothetical protein [Rhizobacter sp.]